MGDEREVNKWQLLLPRCNINVHLGGLFVAVVTSCEYNVCNAPIHLP
jgi:hypothetical protein